jgi:hypothetical protein
MFSLLFLGSPVRGCVERSSTKRQQKVEGEELCTALEQVLKEPRYGVHQKRVVDRFREVLIASRLNADPPLAWCGVGCGGSQHTEALALAFYRRRRRR